MYLSRIILDPKRRETKQALSSPKWLHGAIEQSFDGERRRRLWRVDWLGESCYLLVLSEEQPDFSGLEKQFGFRQENLGWEIKSYTPLLECLARDQRWRFRLCANPVHHSPDKQDGSGRGKKLAHITTEHQRQWLIKRAESCGFKVDGGDFDVLHTEWQKFRKGGETEITLLTAIFEGILTVTDADIFRQALVTGIGRAKAYGCGLLTVMRL